MRFYSMLLAAVMAIMVLPGIANADINAETRAEAIARIQERDPSYGGGAHAGGSQSAANMGMHKGDSAWEEFWVQDLDFRPFMSRLRTVLMEDPGLAECTAKDDIIGFLDQMYLFNMGTSHMDMAITGDDITINCAQTYEGLPADSAPARIGALENLPLESYALVDDGDFMLYMGIQHMPARMMIQLEEMQRQAALAEDMDGPLADIFGGMDMQELEQTMQLMKAMQIDKIVDSTLSGEVGIALYDMPAIDTLVQDGGNVQPTDFTAAVAIGIKDAAYVKEMIGTYGSEIGMTPRADSGANGWDVFDLPMMPGMGIVMNDRILVASTNVDFVLGKLMDGGSMAVAPCQAHFAMNMAAMNSKLMEPGMKMLASEIADDEEIYWPVDSMKYLWDVPEQDGLGYMTMTAYTGDAMRNEMHMKKAVFQYMMYYLSTIGAGAIQTELH